MVNDDGYEWEPGAVVVYWLGELGAEPQNDSRVLQGIGSMEVEFADVGSAYLGDFYLDSVPGGPAGLYAWVGLYRYNDGDYPDGEPDSYYQGSWRKLRPEEIARLAVGEPAVVDFSRPE